MRIYLDNCCYNRPFDPQDQTRIQIETMASSGEPTYRDNFDYTEWQKGLFADETVDSLAEKVRAHAASYGDRVKA